MGPPSLLEEVGAPVFGARAPRHRAKHAAPGPDGRRVGRLTRSATAAVVVAGLAGAVVVGLPSDGGPAAPTVVAAPAATATTMPSGRQTPGRTSRSTERPTLARPPEPSPTATETLSVTAQKTSASGRRWATVDLDLRSAATDSARTGVDLDAGDDVRVTGWTSGVWAEVRVDGGTRWVKARYLRRTAPEESRATGDADAGSGSVSATACPSGSGVEGGLIPDGVKVHRAVCHAFPAVTTYGGVRADSLPEHPSGRALDAMIGSSGQGQAIADWVRAHASRLGVSEVIYAQRIWTVQRSGEGWRPMPDRGSATANHYDHVHVTVYGDAAR